jgi:hypothetical protein
MGASSTAIAIVEFFNNESGLSLECGRSLFMDN